ncbi:YoaK family protein [Vibrio sinaloensis]|nr:YoaK family protein [Vibrio sinaloensis]
MDCSVFQHQAVSHISGTVTLLGASALNFTSQTFHLLMVLISFLLGAILSGIFFIEKYSIKARSPLWCCTLYRKWVASDCLFLLQDGHLTGQYFASAACGLQNAMITTFSGAVVRTTHMTGIITDLGLMIGARLRGEYFDYRKAKTIPFFIFSGFFAWWYQRSQAVRSVCFICIAGANWARNRSCHWILALFIQAQPPHICSRSQITEKPQ